MLRLSLRRPELTVVPLPSLAFEARPCLTGLARTSYVFIDKGEAEIEGKTR